MSSGNPNEKICPCNCSCHTSSHYPNRLCNELVTDSDMDAEVLGAGGRYVCGWCYTVCEGIE
jgi:hypothetical protein